MLKSRYIMIGGFLGAGKTTAILELGRLLVGDKTTVGLISNDQSVGLVDTALMRSKGFDTEEITGGCFCCRFNSLVEASSKLSAQTRPDVFIAEPVGSCTDLRATVSYPLQTIYGDQFVVAPLSVLLDPIRTRRILGLATGKVFSPKVVYIFEKQMEEADILVINKSDLLPAAELDELEQTLVKKYPGKSVLRISARTGGGVAEWLAKLMSQTGSFGDSMEMDYDQYAEGEALLGWLNFSATLTADEFDGNQFSQNLAGLICQRLSERDIEIAHLKMTLIPDSGNDLAVGNVVRSGHLLEFSHVLAESLEIGEFILNLRAEGDPLVLKQIVEEAIAVQTEVDGIKCEQNHLEAFRPGRPIPTHRIT